MSGKDHQKCPGASGKCLENVQISHDLGQKLMSGILSNLENVNKVPDIKKYRTNSRYEKFKNLNQTSSRYNKIPDTIFLKMDKLKIKKCKKHKTDIQNLS